MELNGANFASVVIVHWVGEEFAELSGFLTKNDVSFNLKEKVYVSCVRNPMVCGSDTWALKVEQIEYVEWIEIL